MPKQRKLLSLADDVVELLDASDNASGRVEELVRLAASGNLTLELTPAEAKELAQAAAEAGVTPAQYARIVLTHAIGASELEERLQRASAAGTALLSAALSGLDADRVKRTRPKKQKAKR